MEKIFRKQVALTVCFVMLATFILPSYSFAETGNGENPPEVTILEGSREVTEITVSDDESAELTASYSRKSPIKYQWEINAGEKEEDFWVQIADMDKDVCRVTSPMISSVLKENRAEIRCRVTEGETVTYSSAVTVIYDSSIKSQEIYSEPPEMENLAYFEIKGRTALMALPAEKTGEGELKTYEIRIDYIYEEDERGARPSYVATVAEGSSFFETIDTPQIVGYDPVREDGGDPSKVTFNYSSVTEDIVITIKYRAKVVSYIVEHHQQNINNDNYTLFWTEKKEGKVGTLTEAVENVPKGFYRLPFEQIKIAADGSTVVEIYYDRVYYLMTFKLNGGYGIEPVFARYNTPVDNIVPVKPGYDFAGWNKMIKDENDEFIRQADFETSGLYEVEPGVVSLPDVVPYEKTGYQAIWTRGDADYTVIYWAENPDDNGYTYWGYKQGSGTVGSKVNIDGSLEGVSEIDPADKKYFTYSPEESDKTLTIKGDGSAVANVYFKRKTFTISFIDENGSGYNCGIEEHKHSYNTKETIYYGKDYPDSGGTVPECKRPGHVHNITCYDKSTFRDNMYYKADADMTASLNNSFPGMKLNTVTGEVKVSGGILSQSAYFLYTYDESGNPAWYWGEPFYNIVGGTKPALRTTYSYDSKVDIFKGGCYDQNGNLVCTKTEHAHTELCKGTLIEKVTMKYEAAFSEEWKRITGKYPDSLWQSGKRGSQTIYTNYLDKVPGENLVFKRIKSNGNYQYRLYYCLEKKANEDTTGKKTVSHQGKTYIVDYISTMKSNNNMQTTIEDYVAITGYNRIDLGADGSVPDFNRNREVYFYYDLAEYNISYKNYSGSPVSVPHKFGDDISAEGIIPEYPATLEKDAYKFTGWYTSESFAEASRFDFTGKTMPSHNISLYANWVPQQFEVNFYDTAELTNRLNENPVIHRFGDPLAERPVPPVPEGYTNVSFIGWFYMDNGVEKAIDFDEFRVKKNIDVYAKWSGSETVGYSVKYVIASGQTDGGKQIATSVQGYTKVGNNRTFQAKTGKSLDPEYQSKYYPLVSSHTVLMESGKENEFLFEYVYKEKNQYTIRYLDEDNKEVFPSQVVEDSIHDIVTVNYKYKPGYVADAFQKRLIMTADESRNVITFRYRKDDGQNLAPYTITHYLEDAMSPEENPSYDIYQEFSVQGKSGELRTTNILNIEGYENSKVEAFTYDSKGKYVPLTSQVKDNLVSITLPEEGAKIDIYYDCRDYPYEIRHINDKDKTEIIPAVKGKARYGESIDAKALGGTDLPPAYEVHGPASREHRISIETDLNTAVNNVIEFYYLEKQVYYQYETVIKPKEYSGQSFGYLTRQGEPVYVSSGTAQGCEVITTNPNFEFKGWYTDPECKVPVIGSIYDSYIDPADAKKICPQKIKTSDCDMYDITFMKEGRIKFYALFEPKIASLNITKENADSDDTFIYLVEGSGVSMEVSVQGNSSVVIHNLPLGEYTVTEKDSEWSWRYGSSSKKVSLDADESVTFSEAPSLRKWLSGFSTVNVNRKTVVKP